MRQHEMVQRNTDPVQYSQGRAAVRYKRPAEVVNVRYLPRPEPVHRHRKPPPEWLVILGMILLFRIMPAFLVLAFLALLFRLIFTS